MNFYIPFDLRHFGKVRYLACNVIHGSPEECVKSVNSRMLVLIARRYVERKCLPEREISVRRNFSDTFYRPSRNEEKYRANFPRSDNFPKFTR